MVDVQPFRGLRYKLERIGNLSAVISPPYDAISPEEQAFYYCKSPYNIIRLECGEERPGDSPQNNKYTRAAIAMGSWLGEGILVREERPAFYLVEHSFPYQDGVKRSFSLIARVRLEELNTGQIRPHEITMEGPATDRLRLLESCRANLSPIMGIFRLEGEDNPSLPINMPMDSPALSAVDSYGVTYHTWVVAKEETITMISDFFASKVLYIADGHHRYETALAYQEQQRTAHSPCTGNEAFNFVMMALTSSQDPSLIMTPTHRLVRAVKEETLARLKERLNIYFVEEMLSPLPALSQTLENWLDALKEKGQRGTAFGLYGLHRQHLCLLTVRQKEILQEVMPVDQPPSWKDLDVSILHWVILRGMLGLDNPEKEEKHLGYARDGLEALSRVNSGEYQLAFLLNPAPMSTILAIADAGARMPPKSTYFYPKTPAGLVINPLWND